MPKMRVALLAAILLSIAFLGGCFLLPNRAPEAAFVVRYNVDPTDPLVVDLDASSSSDPDGDEIIAYSWVFGDDVTIMSPLVFTKLVQTPTIRVRFPVADTYNLVLVVRDELGNNSSPAAQTVTVPSVP